MNKLLITLVMLGISTGANAFTRDMNHESRNIVAGVSDSREGAMRKGQDFATNLKSESPSRLKRTLGIYEYGMKTNTIKVEDSRIKIDEFSTASGQVKYRAVVNVDYSYDKYLSDNR